MYNLFWIVIGQKPLILLHLLVEITKVYFGRYPRMIKVTIIGLVLCCCLVKTSMAQEHVTTFGIQFKPIIPGELTNTGEKKYEEDNVAISLKPKFGYTFGMVIRRGLSKVWSLEGGLNFVQRNYNINIADQDSVFDGLTDFRFIGYELPLSGLIYIRLGELMYMNTSLGMSVDYFPSDVQTTQFWFAHYTARRRIFQASVLANVGFEYRTREKGYFYFGASFHRPFKYIAESGILYRGNGKNVSTIQQISGNYLTLDFRYFFNEEPQKRKKKKKDKKKK